MGSFSHLISSASSRLPSPLYNLSGRLMHHASISHILIGMHDSRRNYCQCRIVFPHSTSIFSPNVGDSFRLSQSISSTLPGPIKAKISVWFLCSCGPPDNSGLSCAYISHDRTRFNLIFSEYFSKPSSFVSIFNKIFITTPSIIFLSFNFLALLQKEKGIFYCF